MKIIPDTNVLMEGIDLSLYESVLILPSVLGELDRINHCDNPHLSYKARKALDLIIEGRDEKCNVECSYKVTSSHIAFLDSVYNKDGDQGIIYDIINGKRQKLISDDYIFVTYDKAFTVVLDALEISYQLLEKKEEILYKGYKEVVFDEQEMADFYLDLTKDIGMMKNEYLVIKDNDDNVVDCLRWDGAKFCNLLYKKIKSQYLEDVSPAEDDFTQKLAFDSLYSDRITVLYGRAGSGKTYLSLAYAMQQLQNHKIDKIYIVHSFETLKNAKTLGFLPGDKYEKILGSGLGTILSTKLGGLTVLKGLIEVNKVEIVPTSDLRGVEFGARDLVFMTESQNIDTYTMKTLIQRCAMGCKIIIEGDMLEQVDIRATENGMKKLIEVFAGSEYFSCVKLKKNHRNPISILAENIF